MHSFAYKNGTLYCENVNLQELADRYSGQLVLYADALTKMTGVPLEKIHGHLYFTRAKRVVTLSAPPSSHEPKEEA